MGHLRLRVISIFIFILLTSILVIPTYFGWIGPSNQFQSYNAFPRLSFDKPTGIYQPPNDNSKNYVIEQTGKVKVFDNDPTVDTATVALDLSNRVHVSSEDGLLGIAFHPEFDTNGRVFLYFSEHHSIRYNISGCDFCISTMLAEFTVREDNPLKLNASSERTLIEINQTKAFHRGGQLNFGPDGYLYVNIGEGTNDYEAQRLSSLWGSIARIDVDTKDAGIEYGIPDDNPFVGQNNTREEIYAYGLRNPWRGNFDPVTGDLWVGDVGKDFYEEINIIKKGMNYEWPHIEGKECNEAFGACEVENASGPILAYPHPQIPLSTSNDDPVGVAVIGGHVYHGSNYEALKGDYIFADYSGSIYRLEYDEDFNVIETEFLHKVADAISQIGVDKDNELFITGVTRGQIYRLRDANQVVFILAVIVYLGSIALLVRKNIKSKPEIE